MATLSIMRQISLLKVSIGLIIVAVALLLSSALLPPPVAQPIMLITPTAEATTTPDPVTEGRLLFRAKGCMTCHSHDGLIQASSDSMTAAIWGDSSAPDLTTYQADPDFLRTWLKDPAALRPNTRMPNLELREWEIEALIAFLNSSAVPDS